uniref:Methyltransferase-like protein 13 n=1 Tax=Noccaea caerulescens TaxID=107243 RepID=A0A1J3GPX6_NOCCA
MATDTSTTQSYSEQWYWDDRYTNESEPFDWYQKYSSLAPLINLYVPLRNHPVLVIGCGNSAFSEGMVDDGYEDVVNIDISSVVIDSMNTKYSNRPQLKFDENYRVLKDKGVYILITYGAPNYRLRLFEESCPWTTKLHVIDKSLTEQPLETPKWELTKPISLNAEENSVESAIGNSPDVHYIYVCTKDESLKKTEADATSSHE